MFRRGKLNFVSTKDDRVKVVNERINQTEKHLIALRGQFLDCTRKIAKQRDAYDELAKGFKQYADEEEINESLSEGLKSFTNALTILGDYMDVNAHRMEAKIINELLQCENVCKSTRDTLRTAVAARDKEVLKQRQMQELKSKFAANNSSAADAELLKAHVEVNRTNREIDEIINNFEQRKLNELKTVVSDFILVSLKYHTKSLEVLSASYYDISNIDERHDLAEFQKLMKTKDESKSQKLALKKGLRAQSLDELHERSEMLAPLKRQGKISRGSKNLSGAKGKKDNDDETQDEDDDDGEEQEDDDDDDDEEEEEEEESGNNTNAEEDEEDSGTVSETEDDAEQPHQGRKPIKHVTKLHRAKLQDPFKAVSTHASTTQSSGKSTKSPSLVGIPTGRVLTDNKSNNKK